MHCDGWECVCMCVMECVMEHVMRNERDRGMDGEAWIEVKGGRFARYKR